MKRAGLLLAIVLLAAGCGSRKATPPPSLRTTLSVCELAGSDNAQRLCYQRKVLAFLETGRNPAEDMPRVDAVSHAMGGILGMECHILMHWVGRNYGRDEHVRLADLQNLLPHSNDPGCSAGFSHGLIISLGPQVEQMGPKGAAAACAKAATRYEQYSCVHGLGHAYMRLFDDTIPPALDACRALGPHDAADCAQGVYHDYWLSVSGADATRTHPGASTSPRAICGAQPAAFVRPCWYRALLEAPGTQAIDGPKAVLATCAGLGPLQRSACITGASLIASDDPAVQLAGCATMTAADASACVRGVRSQALVGKPAAQVDLVNGCAAFPAAARGACAAWLGKTLAVVTNGRFPCRVAPPLAAACRRGAASMNGPLETFS